MERPPYDEVHGYIRHSTNRASRSRIDRGRTPCSSKAFESDDPPLQMLVGEDAQETVEMRRNLNDRNGNSSSTSTTRSPGSYEQTPT